MEQRDLKQDDLVALKELKREIIAELKKRRADRGKKKLAYSIPIVTIDGTMAE